MKNDLIPSLICAGLLIAVALGATLGLQLGYLDEDTVTRLVLGATGLMLVWYGNRMPKAFVPSAYARQVNRVGGWAMVLSGLVYAGLWAFAPRSVALIVGCGAVAGGVLVTVAYCISVARKAKAEAA
ncbi:MAG TPA: ammonium transporter [Caulobacteraceae bacterium]|nr:ammonium transporter [Caulobacteraceae bacterium]